MKISLEKKYDILKKYITFLTEKPKIEKGDIVSICIIDSVWFEPSKSTLDFDGKFNYITSCGNKLTTRGKQYYQKGDTITFVKKVKK